MTNFSVSFNAYKKMTFFFFIATICANAQTFSDTTVNYSLPKMYQLNNGQVGMSWLEMDSKGVNHFCWAVSSDLGNTFSKKYDIFASETLRGSRLMKPKVIQKKNGTLVAIFGSSPKVMEAESHDHNAPKKAKRASNLYIVYAESHDNGLTWTAPVPVNNDISQNVIRGFYDSVLMPNDEIAVAFLKDTGNPHERDLRIITSVNGKFGDERLLDKLVCDCCSVNFLVDASGAVNLYYRANNSNIRDMAFKTSTDNAKTFTEQKIIYADNWKIDGCPHSGPVSTSNGSTNYIAWLSGEESSEPGIRLATQNGERLLVMEGTASNPSFASSANNAYLLWESAENDIESIRYKSVNNDDFTGSINQKGSNPVGLVANDTLLIAFESPVSDTKKTIKLERVKL